MVAATRIRMADISGQKPFEARLGKDGLTTRHTVGQAIDHYLSQMQIRDNGLRFSAFSRGVKLDNKRPLGEVNEAEQEWRVLPEVAAGAS